MSGWTAALLSMVFVVNPPGVSYEAAWGDRSASSWRRLVLKALATATAVWATLSLVTGPLLEVIDLSGPTFRLATSVVVGVTGARWFVARPPVVEVADDDRSGLGHLLITLLSPGPIFAAMAANADAGAVAGLASVAVAGAAVVATLLLRRPAAPAGPAITRLVGALAIVVAVGIGIDSARTV